MHTPWPLFTQLDNLTLSRNLHVNIFFFVFEFLTLTKKCSENQEHIKRIYLVLMFLIVDVVDFFKNWQRNIVRFSFSSMLKQIEQ